MKFLTIDELKNSDFVKMKNREKKRHILIATIVIILIIVLCLYFFPIPWNIDRKVSGIQYRNADTSGYYEKKAIHIKGNYKHYLFLNQEDTFTGNVIIDGYDTTKYEFRVFIDSKNKYSFGEIDSFGYSGPNDQFNVQTFGWVKSKPFLKEFSIHVAEPIGTDGNQWSGNKGLIIAAPASNRQEAITIEKSLDNS